MNQEILNSIKKRIEKAKNDKENPIAVIDYDEVLELCDLKDVELLLRSFGISIIIKDDIKRKFILYF